MAANTQPIFIKTPFLSIVTLTDQVTPRAGASVVPLGYEPLIDAGDNGCLIESITAIPILNTGAIADTTLRLFHVGESGIMSLAVPEIVLPAISDVTEGMALTPQQVVLYDVLIGDIGRKGLRLGPQDKLYATLGVALMAGAYNIIATGGWY